MMDKQEIASLIDESHLDLINYYKNQPDEAWEAGPEGKWTSGQHALHLLQTLKTINYALSMPKFFLKARFGKSNRDVRDYDTVSNRYNERLSAVEGATFGPSARMKPPKIKDKPYILNRLQTESKKLQYKTNHWKDKHLDNIILPHPLMGKMPVRELLMWTSYHTNHHISNLRENY